MRTFFTLLGLLVLGSSCGPDPYDGYGGPGLDGSITVDNASSVVITDLRVTPVRSGNWGPNLLPDVLYPDEQITIRVACETWDVLLADEFGRECILPAIYLCSTSERWTIDDRTLDRCGF